MFKDMFEPLMDDFTDEDVEFLPLISVEEDDESVKTSYDDIIPILPLKNTVLFPGVVIPITVGRDKSIKLIKDAHHKDKIIGVTAQKDANVEDPTADDLNTVGTIAKIIKMLKMPDGTTTAIIQGKKRITINDIITSEPYFKADITVLEENEVKKDREFKALIGSMKDTAAQIIQLAPNIPSEAKIVLKNIESPSFLINFIASNLNIDVIKKQGILEINLLKDRARQVLKYMNEELQMLQLKDQIQSKVRTDIEKQQRDFFLHQQMKTIQEELGGDAIDQEVRDLEERAAKMKWGDHIKEVFDKELNKLQRMNPAAAEYSVVYNYLELLLDLPWNKFTKDNFDLKRAKKVLDDDHYGLDKIKDRILEYLAVLKLKGDMKSPILCFVGPPGVGKTSLGKSVARALKRKYVRMSLGGLHDESEVRGHRKTYIGAMPGRIIQSLKKVKASNPVFILDEIDKVGTDFRGDPSSALLEVLDPEQNSTFYDNYLELEYDLSKVMFIATANSLSDIQPALRDRMEVIFINGYSAEEKIQIAKRHLLSKQRGAHGLTVKDIRLTEKVIHHIIENYTRESGVRELDRQIASVMRYIAKMVAMEEEYNHSVKTTDIVKILGPGKFDKDIYQEENPPGVAVGLAWTSVGGEILFIESSLSKGKGNLTLTGNLGDVMKESASTALSFLKSKSGDYNIDPDLFKNWNIHIHVPEGAIPKDGPSAGITMLTALTSLFTQRKVKPYLAMTGEITLRGKVLPVGGIKEKILAAKRAGMKEIILCKTNKKDVDEINADFLKGLSFRYVDRMHEVLDLALEKAPAPDSIELN